MRCQNRFRDATGCQYMETRGLSCIVYVLLGQEVFFKEKATAPVYQALLWCTLEKHRYFLECDKVYAHRTVCKVQAYYQCHADVYSTDNHVKDDITVVSYICNHVSVEVRLWHVHSYIPLCV